MAVVVSCCHDRRTGWDVTLETAVKAIVEFYPEDWEVGLDELRATITVAANSPVHAQRLVTDLAVQTLDIGYRPFIRSHITHTDIRIIVRIKMEHPGETGFKACKSSVQNGINQMNSIMEGWVPQATTPSS